jgi:hypothetical protein
VPITVTVTVIVTVIVILTMIVTVIVTMLVIVTVSVTVIREVHSLKKHGAKNASSTSLNHVLVLDYECIVGVV